jgi:hypothetical protein
MIRICVDVRLSHIQGIALAAALKAVFRPGGIKKEHVFPVEKRDVLLGNVGISPTTARYLKAHHQDTDWCQWAQALTTWNMSLVSKGKTLGK